MLTRHPWCLLTCFLINCAALQVRGSDGSLMLDKFEFLQPEDAYDAFSLFVRTVRNPLAATCADPTLLVHMSSKPLLALHWIPLC
jgi:hypothetical protein